MKPFIDVAAFTSCEVSATGEVISLGMQALGGEAVSLKISPEQASALSMTLPRLLSAALKARYRDETLRYVFSLADYSIEGVPESKDFILSLKAAPGFEVSFKFPADVAEDISLLLQTLSNGSGERPQLQ